jgi:hypothetical protein
MDLQERGQVETVTMGLFDGLFQKARLAELDSSELPCIRTNPEEGSEMAPLI